MTLGVVTLTLVSSRRTEMNCFFANSACVPDTVAGFAHPSTVNPDASSELGSAVPHVT